MTTINKEERINSNITVLEGENEMIIKTKGFQFRFLIIALISIPGAYALIQSDHVKGTFTDIGFAVVLIVVIFLALTYYALVKIINKKVITVNHNQIKVENKPLPIESAVVLKSQDIVQLYVSEQTVADRYYHTRKKYQINAVMMNKQILTVMKGLKNPHIGHAIEDVIEDFLNIEDRPMDGEIAKG